MRKGEGSAVLTLRLPDELDRRIERAARRQRRTKSALVCEVLRSAFGSSQADRDRAHEARRQSLLVGGRPSERDALRFIAVAADTRSWR
jgi:hypothetical protein